MFLDDNLFIQILALEICLTKDAGWLEQTLMYVGIALTHLWFIRSVALIEYYIEKIK